MEPKKINYRSGVRRILGPINGLLTLGFGTAAAFSGFDQQYLLSASEQIAALSFGCEAYNNIRYCERGGTGYISAVLGSIATVANSPVNEGFDYRLVIGTVGIGHSVTSGLFILRSKLIR